jgi:hypothetical protein
MTRELSDWGRPQGPSDFVGTVVRVEKAGAVVRVGEVEAVTPQGDIFWIKASGCEARAMYGAALGQRVYPLRDELGNV